MTTPIQYIASDVQSCEWCNLHRPSDISLIELLHWTSHVGKDFTISHHQSCETQFDAWCYLASYPFLLSEFLIDGNIDDDMVALNWIYVGFPTGCQMNLHSYDRFTAMIQIKSLSTETVLVYNRGSGIIKSIHDLNDVCCERLTHALHYMFIDGRNIITQPFILHLGDGLDHDIENPYNIPVFTFSKLSTLSYQLIPDPYFIKSKGYIHSDVDTIPWNQKINKAFWRGASTGAIITRSNWFTLPRVRLALMSDNSLLDAKISDWVQLQDNSFKDILLSYPCSTSSRVPFNHFFKFKYQINIDGNSCAWNSMFLKLKSNAVVFHVETDRQQWYYQHLVPWVHYIPVRSDLSDLYDKLQWAIDNDNLAKTIAHNGTSLTRRIIY